MAKDGFIDLDNRKLFYTDNQNINKPAVIFIHGFPVDSSMWNAIIEDLSDNYRVITYDLAGLGKSTLTQIPFTFESHVDDLFKLADDLQLNHFILAGLSMGGYIALRAVQKYPERIKGLILCDTQAANDTNTALLGRYLNINIINKEGADHFSMQFMPNVLSEYTRYNNAPYVEYFLRTVKAQSKEGLISNLVALATRTNTSEVLTKIKCPVLGVVGDHDKITTPEIMKDFISKIPGGRFSVIKNSGHFPPIENPQEFNGVVETFLNEIS